MTKDSFIVSTVLLGASLLVAGCQAQEGSTVDKTPIPSVAAPPYICDHVPLEAVRLMTGVRNPIVQGDFDLSTGKELDGKNYGTGGCWIYDSAGSKPKVLQISLSPGKSREEVENEISQGADPLPEIIPGAIGNYGRDSSSGNTQASAVLVSGLNSVVVDLWRGVEGRDSADDVVALMKLVAPKLITEPNPENTED